MLRLIFLYFVLLRNRNTNFTALNILNGFPKDQRINIRNSINIYIFYLVKIKDCCLFTYICIYIYMTYLQPET